MPNVIKYSVGATPSGSLRKGNMLIGNNTADYGLTFFNGINPPSGGYTIYLNKASGGPSIYCPANNTQLISITNQIAGANYTTAAQCLDYFATQTDKIVVNMNYEGIVTDGLVMNLDAGFTPSYPTTGTTWYDISGNGNHATLTNGPTFNSANGGSIVFDGVDDYVTENSSVVFQDKSDFTFSTWFNTAITASNLVSSNTPATTVSASSITLTRSTTNDVNIRFGGTSVTYNNISWTTGSWFNLVYRRQYTNGVPTASLYINNTLSKIDNSQFLSASFTIANIGRRQNSAQTNNYFLGSMSMVWAYNRVLTTQEITQNYNALKGRFGL